MTWALYATPSDMEQIEAGLSEIGMSNQDRNRVRPYVNGGLGNWRNAPCIPPEHPCFASDGVSSGSQQVWVDDGNGEGHWETIVWGCMREIVCTHGTLADFRALCRTLITKYPQAAVFRFFEPFMGDTGGGAWYAVDPYPPPAGYFDGMTC